ncbi:MAG: hypothetical protein K5984_00920 [Bacteroidales bacterium]|nr:hypothetical protein [Bacteroidales bacterium]
MNIIVKTKDGGLMVRPDTTWEKDNEDFYPPEFVQELTYTPVLFARVCKPGRSVGEQFADRYFDSIGFGILLYPENLIDGKETGICEATMVDHTSFLTAPMYNRITLGQEGNVFRLCKNGEKIYEYDGGSVEMIKKALSEATRYIFIRTGDMIAIELEPRKPLCGREDTAVSATWCENSILDFNIVF